MAENRQNLNVELGDGAKEKLASIRQWNGMTQKEMVSRLIGWFCDQDRVVQQVILGQIPEEIAPDVARLMLERMADASPQDAPQARIMGEIRSRSTEPKDLTKPNA